MLSITRWLPRRQDETQGGQRGEIGGVGDDAVPRKGVGRGTGSRLGRWLSNRDVENQQGPPRSGGNRADTGHGSSQRPSRCSARVLCPGHHRPSGPPLSVSHTEAAWFKKISCHFKLLFSTVLSSQETREEDAEISDTLSSPYTLGCPRRQHPHQRGPLVIPMNLCRHVIVTQSSQLPSGSRLVLDVLWVWTDA